MKRLDPLAVPLAGTHLVEASAGTGKTYTLATLYLRLLLEKNLAPREILVVTYTNAATAELRARIRQRLTLALAALRDDEAVDPVLAHLVRDRRATASSDCRKLTAALYTFDEAAIFTIHGFCQRVLLEHAFESGMSFECELLTDQTPLVDEVVRDFWARELYEASEPLVRSVLESGENLQAFAALVEKIAPQRDVRVLPSASPADVDTVLEEWRAAHRSVLEMWTTDRDDVVQLLQRSCEGLKRNSYPPDKIAGWAERTDVELPLGRPGILRRFSHFDRFASSTLAARTKNGYEPPAHRFFDACQALLVTERRLDEELARRRLGLALDLLVYARHELERRKEASNTQFFDDLLYRLDEALGRSDGAFLAERIRRRFTAALIDEFQDTDPVQYRIFRRLYHGREDTTLFLVGDPKQAIYAFRGADVFAYLEAKRDAAEGTHTLAVNWRADPTLMRGINTLFGNARRPFLLPEIPFVRGEARGGAKDCLEAHGAPVVPLEVLFLPRDRWKAGAKNIGKGVAERALPEAIAAEISQFLDSDPTIDGHAVQPSDIAVLCRTNDQAAEMQLALRALHLPSVLLGDASVFDAPEASQLEQVLRAMAQPSDAAALRAALATPVMGKTASELLALADNERDWEAWAEHFEHWHEVWLRNGFIPAFRRMLDTCDAAARLLRLVDGERRLTNLLHLGELLQTAVRETKRGPLALVEWLREMRTDVRLRTEVGGEAAQVRLESDREALKLTTVHKSKGLEYPIVYCPFFWDGRRLSKVERKSVRFHDPEDDYRLKFDLGSPNQDRHCEQAEHEALAENLRLLYVAATRAKHRCTLVWGAVYQPEHSALGYLLHQPRGTDEDTLPNAIAANIKDLDDVSMRADLDRLVDASAGAIEVRDLTTRAGIPYAASTTERVPLQGRTAARHLTRSWRVGSFSSLTALSHESSLSREAEEGVDHDQDVTSGADVRPHEGAVVLHDFPAGARPGRLIHEILEHLDFEDSDPSSVRRQVETTMHQHGFDAAGADTLTRAIQDVLATPLADGDSSMRLGRIAMHRRLNEMEFVFPVATPSARASTFDSDKLADILAPHAGTHVPSDYIDQVRRLGFVPLAGYLKGYIDLAFEHNGMWYVVDYKSNLLGTGVADYEPRRLETAMRQHHYYLQSYFYTVAVHRYLALRLLGYDYDRHFGGTFYLFLRGMAPAHPPGNGIYRSRLPRGLVEDLSELLADPMSAEERRGG